jgi:hypothetical protein
MGPVLEPGPVLGNLDLYSGTFPEYNNEMWLNIDGTYGTFDSFLAGLGIGLC